MRRSPLFSMALFLIGGAALAQEAARPAEAPRRVTPQAKVYIEPFPNCFETYLVAAFQKKHVPVVVLNRAEGADFKITGFADSRDPSLGRKLLYLWQTGSDEVATMSVSHIPTGTVVFAYATKKKNSAHGKQSAAESCAKHFKAHIEGKE